MQFEQLTLADDRVTDHLGTVQLGDLLDLQPDHPARLWGATPLEERLWRIALADIEDNIVETDRARYFGAGRTFGATVFTRDISFSGVLGLNRLYPKLMRDSLRFTRDVRLELGFKVTPPYAVEGLGIDWDIEDLPGRGFIEKYKTNCYVRRTDDVIWLWAAGDLQERSGEPDGWEWIYDTGKECFNRFYAPFFDESDGLYRGQATFVDIAWPGRPASGYPSDLDIADCVMLKALSTNCLYVRGLQVMASAARETGREEEGGQWDALADRLAEAIRTELRREDGALAYYKASDGRLSDRRDALGSALAVLLGVVDGDDARAALADYPFTGRGAPLIFPFYPDAGFYHNYSAWPFVDAFFAGALERAEGVDCTGRQAAVLARVCRDAGGFRELVDFRTGEPCGSEHQLWSAAGFVDACYRAGLVEDPCKGQGPF